MNPDVMNTSQALITVGVIAVGTMITRFLPFLLFPEGRKAPGYITYLGKALPGAVIAFLVIYCLKTISLPTYPYGLPEAVAVALTVALHLWKKQTLLSIAAGTVIYMFLVQRVF